MTLARADGAGGIAAPTASPADALAAGVAARILERVRELEALFERIAATRMQGVPILHPGLAVKAVGFRPTPDAAAAIGVLVTPWFMNLVWLPLARAVAPAAAAEAAPASTVAGVAAGGATSAAEPTATPVGATRTRLVGHERFDFIGAHEPGFGPYEACSLFSPMADFADQAAALATAEQVMLLLHQPPAAAAVPEALPAAQPVASRRALLFGRAASAAPGDPGGRR